MTLIEDQLNGRIASVIRQLTRTTDWSVSEEIKGALRGGGGGGDDRTSLSQGTMLRRLCWRMSITLPIPFTAIA